MSVSLSRATNQPGSLFHAVPNTSRIRQALELLSVKQDLPEELAMGIMEDLLNGELSAAQVGGLLFGLKMKGESSAEIAAFAKTLRQVSQKISAPPEAMDTCGTGGDGSGTFNISTTAAFVVAGAGVPVAKHGNRFASGKCGSADVLEQLGIAIDRTIEDSERCLREHGIAFLFAPLYHPALAKVAAHRRELGVRTVFNLLGPLLNPAQTRYQLLGVSSPEALPKMAQALQILGTKRAVVVYGEDGLDEVSLSAPTRAILVTEEEMVPFTIQPEDYGFSHCRLEELKGGSPQENARITLSILQGKTGPERDVVLLNAGVALYACGKAADIQAGVEMARQSLDSGQALAKFEALKNSSLREMVR